MYYPSHTTIQALMTFLPSFLMISISYATSFFRLPSFFNTAITVSPSKENTIRGRTTLYKLLTLLLLLWELWTKMGHRVCEWTRWYLLDHSAVLTTKVLKRLCLSWLYAPGKSRRRGCRSDIANVSLPAKAIQDHTTRNNSTFFLQCNVNVGGEWLCSQINLYGQIR